jgi:methyltransferase (TIGR00027 family)
LRPSPDELILRAVEADGYRQVVVVGAGYDMRPSRFAGRLGGVRWFEVDLPAMTARKQALLARLPGVAREVEHVAADLGTTSLLASLAAHGFDPAAPACFVLEGLIHYLSADALDALLAEVAAGSGRRRALLSFIRTDVYLAAGSPLRTLFRLMREIPRLHFTRNGLARVCARHGLGRYETWPLREQVRCFAPEATGRPVGSSQDVAQLDRAV